jgi:pyridoxine 5-phosphate synthase
MLRLGVNIDHVATLREARYRGRGFGEPDPVAAALACEAAGAHGITAHLREDRRHIQDRDVLRLRERIRTRLNFEMALAPEIAAFALRLRADFACLVPERRQEVTTEGGLDVAGQLAQVTDLRARLNDAGTQVSLFVGPDAVQIEAAARSGAQCIELHTGAYAELRHEGRDPGPELARLAAAAAQARALGLRVNAGHGLSVANLPALLAAVPHLEELNIGHSLVARALAAGFAQSVQDFLAVMQGYPAPA